MFIELFIDIAHRVNAQRALALLGAERIVIGVRAGLHQLTATAVAAAFMSFGLAAHQEAAQRVNQRISPPIPFRDCNSKRVVASSGLIATDQLLEQGAATDTISCRLLRHPLGDRGANVARHGIQRLSCVNRADRRIGGGQFQIARAGTD